MKIKDIISYIRGVLKDYSRTPEYTDAFLWSLFVKKRSVYLNRELEKNKYINPQNYQSFCFPLELSELTLCETPISICKIRKSINKIPTAITSRNNLILNVRNMFGKKLSKIEIQDIEIIKYNDIKKKELSWFIQNDYLYVYGSLEIEKVNIEALWEDISELDLSISQCDSIFNMLVSIDNKTLDVIVQLIVETLIPLKQIPLDNTNDSNSSIK